MKKILFVCSGNTCRSPLAEGIAKKLFADNELNISSAGTSALDGLPASSLAVKVAADNSIDISGHRARFLTKALVDEADLIVALAANHRETIGIIEPGALAHTLLLTELCDAIEGDVPDPIGMGYEEYERTFELIERCLSQFKSSIQSFDGWK